MSVMASGGDTKLEFVGRITQLQKIQSKFSDLNVCLGRTGNVAMTPIPLTRSWF